MNYTYCNDEDLIANKIILLPSKTYGKLYKDKISLDNSDLPAGQCRSILQLGEVDTCSRNYVNAEMKIEGWKSFQDNSGSYCHLYKHYFPRIHKWTDAPTLVPTDSADPTSMPTLAPSATVAPTKVPSQLGWGLKPSISCTIKGSGQSCTNYISNLSVLTPEFCIVDVEYTYEVENLGTLCVEVSSVIATVDEQQVSNLPVSAWNFCPGDEVVLKEERREDLCAFAGREVDIRLLLNDKEGSPTMSSIAFPYAKSVSSEPTKQQ